jgi:hypothetical protein
LVAPSGTCKWMLFRRRKSFSGYRLAMYDFANVYAILDDFSACKIVTNVKNNESGLTLWTLS